MEKSNFDFSEFGFRPQYSSINNPDSRLIVDFAIRRSYIAYVLLHALYYRYTRRAFLKLFEFVDLIYPLKDAIESGQLNNDVKEFNQFNKGCISHEE